MKLSKVIRFPKDDGPVVTFVTGQADADTGTLRLSQPLGSRYT